MLSSLFEKKKTTLVSKEEALKGRGSYAFDVPKTHEVLDTPIAAPAPAGCQEIVLGMGCFWGAERKFWQCPGVWTTAVGYAGGHTPYPTYREVCSGQTGHTEVVRVVFDPEKVPLEQILKLFWESHDPTQGMRQGGDRGTQYRSALYTTTPEQAEAAARSLGAYQEALRAAGHQAPITTELAQASTFYYAEGEHQQYLAKNPGGYCGLGGTGVSCPVGAEKNV